MLAHLVPSPLVRVFARPYVAGNTMAAALEKAAAVLDQGNMLSTLDLLGESVRHQDQVEHNEQVYLQLVDAVAQDPSFADPALRPSVSLKPSAFTAGDQAEAFEPIRRVLERAQTQEVAVTIDMEDRSWTEITLERTAAFFARALRWERSYRVGCIAPRRISSGSPRACGFGW